MNCPLIKKWPAKFTGLFLSHLLLLLHVPFSFIYYFFPRINRHHRLATSPPFLKPWLTYLERWASSLSDEIARASARDVSCEKSTCFTCRSVNQNVNFWREKRDWHFSLFMCSARDCCKSRKWFPSKRLRVLYPNSNEFIYVQCSM